MVLSIVVVLCVAVLCNSTPIPSGSLFKEAEYDVTLEQAPGQQRSYFIKQNEMPIYEQQFAKIRELGEQIDCKITGNCGGSKRGYISKKSMFDDGPQGNEDAAMQDQAGMNADPMGGMAGPAGAAMNDGPAIGSMGGEDMGMSPPSPSALKQKDPASFGQQPQMDIKLSKNEMDAVSAGYGHFSNPMGPMSQPPSTSKMIGNDELTRVRDQQNAQTIDMAIADKMKFMDKANGPSMTPPMQGAGMQEGIQGGMPETGGGAVSDPLSQFSHTPEGKDDMPGSVSENDLMKAEDIQPNEMKGINSFLKDSNHVDKPESDQMISDAPSEDGAPGKTNVDFGGQQANIENEGQQGGSEGGDTPDPSNGPMTGPVTPGGQEVPTLNNLGLGMSAAEVGPPGMPPSLSFVQDHTRQMIQQNSDYKLPHSALSNLWNSYMSSTQSVLGEKDPSANSRHSIWRPTGKKLHRRSNVERVEKTSLIPKGNNNNPKKNIVYIPAFVIKNVLKNIKKSMTAVPQSQQQQQKSKINNNNPPIYITEKQGKRFLVINPSNPAFVEGFADVDHQYAGFKLPLNNNLMSGYPLQQQPNMESGNQEFGTPGIFPAAVQGPWSSMKISGIPILRGQTIGGVFRGYMAVPVLSRLPVNEGFAQPLYPPQPEQQQPFLYNHMYQQHQAPSYLHEAPRVVEQLPQYPLFHQRADGFFNNHVDSNIQSTPYLNTQQHPYYYPIMSPTTTQEFDNNRLSSNYYLHHPQPTPLIQPASQFGLVDYHYIHDRPGEARSHSFFHYRGDPGYQGPLLPQHNFYRDQQPVEQEENFQLSQSRDVLEQQQQQHEIVDQQRFASDRNTANSEEDTMSPSSLPLPAPVEPAVSAKPFQFQDIHESEVEANRGSMFSSYFNNGPTSSEPYGQFMEKSNIENQQQQPQFEMDNQMVKRSHQQPQHHQGPYVFTKDHVGFGPITVEAHTASYKGSDPKDDDK